MTRRKEHVPFDGVPPIVERGQQVEIRDASGRWRTATAAGPARYDDANSAGWRTFLTVPVHRPSGVVNWPAEDVRPANIPGEAR